MSCELSLFKKNTCSGLVMAYESEAEHSRTLKQCIHVTRRLMKNPSRVVGCHSLESRATVIDDHLISQQELLEPGNNNKYLARGSQDMQDNIPKSCLPKNKINSPALMHRSSE